MGEVPSWPELLSSRTFFYPGSGFDGCPFAVFGASHSCHFFVYADVRSYATFCEHLSEKRDGQSVDGHPRLRGYRVISREAIDIPGFADFHDDRFFDGAEDDRLESGWIEQSASAPFEDHLRPWSGVFTVFERLPDLCHHHGPRRFAWLFVQSEAVSFFERVFGRFGTAPFGMLLRTYTGFDPVRGGVLERRVAQLGLMPDFLQGPEGGWDCNWPGYQEVARGKLEYRRGVEVLLARGR